MESLNTSTAETSCIEAARTEGMRSLILHNLSFDHTIHCLAVEQVSFSRALLSQLQMGLRIILCRKYWSKGS